MEFETEERIKWSGRIAPEHHIAHAFSIGDIHYFNFTDAFNIPCERALDALTIYEEMNMRCTREFLLAHTSAMENLLLGNPINIFEIHKLNSQLKERLAFIFYPQLVKKLASVYYFDETENPYKYDARYAEQKIALWDKEKVDDFFLLQPIAKLLPSFNISEENLVIYSSIVEKVGKQHLKDLFTNMSPSQQKNDLFSKLFYTENTKPTTD